MKNLQKEQELLKEAYGLIEKYFQIEYTKDFLLADDCCIWKNTNLLLKPQNRYGVYCFENKIILKGFKCAEEYNFTAIKHLIDEWDSVIEAVNYFIKKQEKIDNFISHIKERITEEFRVY